MIKVIRRLVSNRTHPTGRLSPNSGYLRFPHYNATIIQLGWLGSPRYRKLLKKKLKKRRKKLKKYHAAVTIQAAWFRSSLYQRLFIKKINAVVCRVEKLDLDYVDEYIRGIERIIKP